MPFLPELAWQDLKASGRRLWVFCACLTLGVSLIAAAGIVFKVLEDSLLADTRALLGGDLEVDSAQPLPDAALAWMRQRGEVSLVTELATMLGGGGQYQRVELQATSDNYPLYGTLRLDPDISLESATALQANATGQGRLWGVAVDPVLIEKLALQIGDRVQIGQVAFEIRAILLNQPDRNLNANWRGPPVLIAEKALANTGLVQPGSRLDFEYHVKTDINPEQWRDAFYRDFPDQAWEVRTFEDRSERIAERLAQIGSGLLIIAFTTLFVGGLGVYNSIQPYLRSKLKTIATLSAIGFKDRQLTQLYLIQVAILSTLSSLVGALFGALLALLFIKAISSDLSVVLTPLSFGKAMAIATVFGFLTAISFAMLPIGRALSVKPALLFRGDGTALSNVSQRWRIATLIAFTMLILLVLWIMPDIMLGLGFLVVSAGLVLFLNGVVLLVQRGARHLEQHPALDGHFMLKFGLANLHRPGNSLRSALISLGSALTLMVACALVVTSLLRTVNTTIPEDSPALVLYDVLPYQRNTVLQVVQEQDPKARIELAPLVRARMAAINSETLDSLAARDKVLYQEASRDEFKLSSLGTNLDGLTLVAGEWWEEDDTQDGSVRVAMEDREFKQIGLQIGDTITFDVTGQPIEGEIVAVYKQKGVQTRFWFEGIISGKVLESIVSQYVGTAFLSDEGALTAQQSLAGVAPNIITVRTARLLATARDLLAKGSLGMTVIAVVSLFASLLVLASVVAASRERHVYTATVLHSMGARHDVIRKSMQMEYALIGGIVVLFSTTLGALIALPLLRFRMKLPSEDLIWVGLTMACLVSVTALGLGARYMNRRLTLSPALLLREGG